MSEQIAMDMNAAVDCLQDFRRRWPVPPPVITEVYLEEQGKLRPAFRAFCHLADLLVSLNPSLLVQLAETDSETLHASHLVRKLIERKDGVDQHYWVRSDHEDEPNRQISAEAVPGEGSPNQVNYPNMYGLRYEANLNITRDFFDALLPSVASSVAVPIEEALYGPGGFQHFSPVPSVQIRVRSTPERVQQFASLIGLLAQQTEVFVSRADPKGNSEAIDILTNDAGWWQDTSRVIPLWADLRAAVPEGMAEGFQPVFVILHGRPMAGIRIIRRVETADYGTTAAWSDQQYRDFAAALNDVADRHHIPEAQMRGSRVQVEILRNNWKEHPDGKDYRHTLGTGGRYRLQGRNLDDLVAHARILFEQAFKKHASEVLHAHREARRETNLAELATLGHGRYGFLGSLVAGFFPHATAGQSSTDAPPAALSPSSRLSGDSPPSELVAEYMITVRRAAQLEHLILRHHAGQAVEEVTEVQ